MSESVIPPRLNSLVTWVLSRRAMSLLQAFDLSSSSTRVACFWQAECDAKPGRPLIIKREARSNSSILTFRYSWLKHVQIFVSVAKRCQF